MIYLEKFVIKCYLSSELIIITNIPVNSTLNIYLKAFKASHYSSKKHFNFDNVLLINRRLALWKIYHMEGRVCHDV